MSLKNKLNSFKMLASMAEELYSTIKPPNNLGLYDTFNIISSEPVNSFKALNKVDPDLSCKTLATISLMLLIFLNFKSNE